VSAKSHAWDPAMSLSHVVGVFAPVHFEQMSLFALRNSIEKNSESEREYEDEITRDGEFQSQYAQDTAEVEGVSDDPVWPAYSQAMISNR
jgi:hypothetical protein